MEYLQRLKKQWKKLRLSYQWSSYLGRIGQTVFWHVFFANIFLFFRKETSLEIERQRKITNEAEITEKALIKLIKITRTYESFVSFIGCELNEKVLEE